MYVDISNPLDYRAGLYIRLSKEDENEGPSESVTNQQSLLNQFVEEQRLAVYDTYIDDGWSGANFDRPGFRRLLADIEAKRVNLVVTKDLSRLGRDYILTGHYLERYFPERRVRYISLLDGIDTGVDSSVNDITPFRAIINDLYAKDISKKIKSVKQDKQRKGQFIGGKPVYGYQMSPQQKNKIVIDGTAAAVVRRIFSLALAGLSCRQIAAQLNEEGVPTPATYAGLTPGRTGPYSGKWSGERVSEMLQNETYIGNMVQGRTRKISYKSKKCVRQPRENWVVVAGTHEPLIDGETFRQVGLLLDSRKTTRSRTYDFLLKGLIFCHECGYPLAVLNRRNAQGADCLYFVCRTYQRFTKASACTCHSVKEQRVTAAVLERVRQACASYLQAERLLPLAEQAVKKAASAAGGGQETAALKAQMASLTARLDKMYLDKLAGVLDEQDFQRLYPRAKGERAALEARLRTVERPDCPPERPEQQARELVRRFADSAYSSRELLISLIERVELTADKQIIIRFRCRPPAPAGPDKGMGESHSLPYLP